MQNPKGRVTQLSYVCWNTQALKFMDNHVPFLRTVSSFNLSPHFRASPTLRARDSRFPTTMRLFPSAAVWGSKRNINAQKCRLRIHPSRKPHAARINKKNPGNRKNKQEEKLACLLSSTLFFPLTSKVTFVLGLVVQRHALLSTTTFYPSTPTSRDQIRPRLRKSTPSWRGWLRRLCKAKLGQADSRQVESGRDSRVVQAFSARSSPLETTPKSVVVSPLRRHFTLKVHARAKAKHSARWNREGKLPGCEEDPEKRQTGLSEYGEICISRQFISFEFRTRCLFVSSNKIRDAYC